MNITTKKGLLAGLVGVFAAGGMTQAVAQGGEAATGQSAIDEIIVTATKRATTLQDTAMSIRALSQEDIERASIVSMGDYLSGVPGVSQVDYGTGQSRLSMRGISANLRDESTVGVYLGEVSLSTIGDGFNSSAADLKLVDIERIEILRGPQGTLYGSAALSGAVRNIPNAPNLQKFEANFQTGISSTDGSGDVNNKLSGVVNVPLVEDELALRVVAYRFEKQGYIDLVSDSDAGMVAAAAAFGGVLNNRKDVGHNKYTGMRASLLWQPTDNLSGTLTYVTQDLDQEGMLTVRDGYTNLGFDLNGKFSGHDQEGRWDEREYTNLVVNYDLGWGDVLSSSTFSNGSFGQVLDFAIAVPWPAGTINNSDVEGFTQELRVSSRLDGPFQFLGGVYYEDLDRQGAALIKWTGDNALNVNGDPTEPRLFENTDSTSIEQKAIFGEISYEINEDINLTIGARRFDYDRGFTQVDEDLLFAPGGGSTDRVTNESGTKGRVNLAYAPDEDSLVYAQWSQGFRLGKTIKVQSAALCDTDGDGNLDGTTAKLNTSGALESDNLDSYEIGGKFGFMNDRIVVNGSFFHIDWEGIPVNLLSPTNPACGTELNAGEARSRGLEIETNIYLTDSLGVDFGASYIDAELTEDAPGLGVKDDRLPYTPRVNAFIGLDYNFDLNGHESFIYASYAYLGGYHDDFAEMSTPEMGDYGSLNLRAGIALNKMIDVEFYGTNLLNSDEVTFSQLLGNFRQTPREIGMDISFRF